MSKEGGGLRGERFWWAFGGALNLALQGRKTGRGLDNNKRTTTLPKGFQWELLRWVSRGHLSQKLLGEEKKTYKKENTRESLEEGIAGKGRSVRLGIRLRDNVESGTG